MYLKTVYGEELIHSVVSDLQKNVTFSVDLSARCYGVRGLRPTNSLGHSEKGFRFKVKNNKKTSRPTSALDTIVCWKASY